MKKGLKSGIKDPKGAERFCESNDNNHSAAADCECVLWVVQHVTFFYGVHHFKIGESENTTDNPIFAEKIP